MKLTVNINTRIIKTGRLSLILLAFLLFNFSSKAQNSDDVNPRKANIELISRIDADSVILRWAPSTAGGWVIANKIGYIVEKISIDADKPIDKPNFINLNENPLKPLDLETWKSATNKENMFSAIAAQALYGQYFNPRPMNTGGFDALKNAADELTNRYSFSLFAADNDAFTADALGLRWVDKDIENGKTYAYRVYLAEKTDEYTFDTAYIVVDIKPYPENIKPANLRFESGDGRIKLFWDDNNMNLFSGYYIFRSEDDGKNFSKLNDMPMVNITPPNAAKEAAPSYIDTATINYKKYIYQVRGIDPFAVLSSSAEIEAFSKDLSAPPPPKMNKAEQVLDQQMKISWSLENAPEDLQGFIVSRSNNSLDNYHLITQEPLPKNTFEFIDNLTDASEAYYVVASVDTAGNMSFSVPVLGQLINDLPPSIPTGLKGKIDEKGKVTLQWNKSLESNIKGYRVLWSNDPTHEFIQLTGQIYPDTIFTDSISLNTLTKNIYYRIAAVNNRHQHSEMSKILKLKRPDIVKPVDAVFSDVFVTDTNVILKWHPSSSEDLAKQVLYKKLKDEKKWTVLDTLSPSVNSYTDNDVKAKISYNYTIVEIDSSGLHSDKAFPVMARPYDTGKRDPIKNFSVEYLKETKSIRLNWNYKLPEKEKIWYVIYKADTNSIYKEYKSIHGNEFSFTDKDVRSGINKYGIKVMTSYGGESIMITTSINIEDN